MILKFNFKWNHFLRSVRHFEFMNFEIRCIISNFKYVRVPNFFQMKSFFELFHHLEFPNSKFEITILWILLSHFEFLNSKFEFIISKLKYSRISTKSRHRIFFRHFEFLDFEFESAPRIVPTFQFLLASRGEMRVEAPIGYFGFCIIIHCKNIKNSVVTVEFIILRKIFKNYFENKKQCIFFPCDQRNSELIAIVIHTYLKITLRYNTGVKKTPSMGWFKFMMRIHEILNF